MIGVPVVFSVCSSAETVADGTACRSTAHAPATCGEAIDVPLTASYPPPVTADTIASPGAASDRKDAALEKYDITSLLSVEATLTADEMQAGVEMANGMPLLPDATTVATPTARRLSMIGLYGSLSHAEVNRPPARLMLTDAMLC